MQPGSDLTPAFSRPVPLSVTHARRTSAAQRVCPSSKSRIVMGHATVSSVTAAAARRGFHLKDDSLGPLLNMSLYRKDAEPAYAGSITGAVLPNSRLHIEAYKAAPRARRGGLLDVSPGMMLFIAALAFGQQNGAKGVYGLAINDAPDQHRRLLRYLKRFGGHEVQRVTGSLADVPARMFYGGIGTVIRGDIDQMLTRGQGMLERTTPIIAPLLN